MIWIALAHKNWLRQGPPPLRSSALVYSSLNGLPRVAPAPGPSYVLLSFTLREEKFTLRSIRNPRTFVTAIAAAFVALALMAPVASAWTPENGGFSVGGTLTLKRAGTDAKTCSVGNGGSEFGHVLNLDQFVADLGVSGFSGTTFVCNGSYFRWYLKGDGFLKEGKQMMAIGPTATVSGTSNNPWGETSWTGEGTVVNTVWTNATATTPSYVVLSESVIGHIGSGAGPAITATGTLYFKTMFGGKLTLP
jgi:hypothetical protein